MEMKPFVAAIEQMEEEHLRVLLVAIKRRRFALARSLRVGQKVEVVMNARPQYLAGARATVVGFRGQRVVVDLETPVGRFHRGVRCPVGLLKPAR